MTLYPALLVLLGGWLTVCRSQANDAHKPVGQPHKMTTLLFLRYPNEFRSNMKEAMDYHSEHHIPGSQDARILAFAKNNKVEWIGESEWNRDYSLAILYFVNRKSAKEWWNRLAEDTQRTAWVKLMDVFMLGLSGDLPEEKDVFVFNIWKANYQMEVELYDSISNYEDAMGEQKEVTLIPLHEPPISKDMSPEERIVFFKNWKFLQGNWPEKTCHITVSFVESTEAMLELPGRPSLDKVQTECKKYASRWETFGVQKYDGSDSVPGPSKHSSWLFWLVVFVIASLVVNKFILTSRAGRKLMS